MTNPTRTKGTNSRIEIRITEEEKAILRDQANSASLTMSEYVRRSALGKRILSTMDQKAAGELARLVDFRSICSRRSKVSRMRKVCGRG